MVKTHINQLQKEIKDNLRIESQASWEKFCNDISLETNHTESWRKIKNFLKPKGQRDYPALRRNAKTAKTNADKAQLFAESVERHFGIQSDNFDLKHFDEDNQFIEDNYVYFCPPEDPDDYRADMDDDHDLVADIDSDTLIRIVKFLNPLRAAGEKSRQCGTSSSHGGRENSTEKHRPVFEGISWEPCIVSSHTAPKKIAKKKAFR